MFNRSFLTCRSKCSLSSNNMMPKNRASDIFHILTFCDDTHSESCRIRPKITLDMDAPRILNWKHPLAIFSYISNVSSQYFRMERGYLILIYTNY